MKFIYNLHICSFCNYQTGRVMDIHIVNNKRCFYILLGERHPYSVISADTLLKINFHNTDGHGGHLGLL